MSNVSELNDKRKNTKEEIELEKVKKYFQENESTLVTAYYSLQQKNNESYYDYSEKGKITSFLVKKFIPKFVKDNNYISFADDLYMYENGVYIQAKDHLKDIQNMLSSNDPQIVRNVKNTSIALKTKYEVMLENVNSNNDIINFRNGIYNIKNNKLENHNPNILSTIQVNGNYSKFDNDVYESSMFKEYIKTSFNDCDHDTIQEIFGYCLTGYTQAQKMFFFLGEGRNGKGVLLRLIDNLYKDEFKSAIRLEHMSNDDRLAQLFGKYINIAGDISPKYIEDDAIIKSVIGQDPLLGSKKYKDTMRFFNKAKFLFSGQKMPGTAGKEFAFLERLIIIKCDRIISPENRIPNLDNVLCENEFELILSWAIEGLKRLIKNNFRFTVSEQGRKNIENYDYENNSLKQFVQICCNTNVTEKSFIPKSEFTKIYEQFCKLEGLKPLMAKTRIKTMEDLKIIERHTKLYNGRYWLNIAWNKLSNELFKELGINREGNLEDNYNETEREGIELEE
jgi:putative DNA primase/helicase